MRASERVNRSATRCGVIGILRRKPKSECKRSAKLICRTSMALGVQESSSVGTPVSVSTTSILRISNRRSRRRSWTREREGVDIAYSSCKARKKDSTTSKVREGHLRNSQSQRHHYTRGFQLAAKACYKTVSCVAIQLTNSMLGIRSSTSSTNLHNLTTNYPAYDHVACQFFPSTRMQARQLQVRTNACSRFVLPRDDVMRKTDRLAGAST